MEANLADEVDEVRCQPERHPPRLTLEVSLLDVYKVFDAIHSWESRTGLEPRVTAAESSAALAEAHRGEALQFCLIEGV